jgi:hypothetical protein
MNSKFTKLIYGIKVDNKDIDFFEDKYIPYVEGHQDIDYSIIIGKDYFIFGVDLASSSDDTQNYHKVVLYRPLSDDIIKILNEFNKLFPLINNMDILDCKLHYVVISEY